MIFLKNTNKMLVKSNFISYKLRKKHSWVEIKVPVPWGYIAGKWWGPRNKRPILAIHGWQDNCGTFDRLIPCLPNNLSILALDFPGHGQSSWLPLGMFYHGMNGPILIKQLKEYFGWNKISFLGHSMGAITSYTYSILYPESVDFLICIDGVKPLVLPNNTDIIIKSINSFLKYENIIKSNKPQPAYTIDELKQRLFKGSRKSVLPENAMYILERNVTPSKANPNKFTINRDPRLKTGPLVNWPQEELVKNAKRLTCPILIIKVNDNYLEKREHAEEVLSVLKKSSKDYRFYQVNGTHHVHLNDPETITHYIQKFLKSHYVENIMDENDVINKINLALY